MPASGPVRFVLLGMPIAAPLINFSFIAVSLWHPARERLRVASAERDGTELIGLMETVFLEFVCAVKMSFE